MPGYFKNLIFVHGVLYSPVAVIITQVLTTARQSIDRGCAVVQPTRPHNYWLRAVVVVGLCGRLLVDRLLFGSAARHDTVHL